MSEETRKVFNALLEDSMAAMESNELSRAETLLSEAEKLIPGDPAAEEARKTLTGRIEEVAKAISDKIGYIESVNKKWGHIIISRIKGVDVDLDEKIYTIGKDGAPKEMTVKKISASKLSVITKEDLDQFEERKKVTRKPE